MKVLLIYPPLHKIVKTQHPDSIEKDAPGKPPPLGLLYVAGSVVRNCKHELHIIDAIIDNLSYKQIEDRVRKTGPDVVGIYATIFTFRDVLDIARIVKSINKNIHVCVGGPLIVAYPEEAMTHVNFDSAIVEEGEISFVELLDCIDKKKPLHSVKGILYRENGQVRMAEARQPIEDLDSLPFPARELVPYKKYYDLIGREKIMTTISTSRGCPNRCAFCNRLGINVYRMRSPKNVVDEIEECIKLGIGEFFFIDDTFTHDRERVIAICDEILKRRLHIKWDVRTRVDALDNELAIKMKEAGCSLVRIGIESGSDKVLKQLNKRLTVAQVEKTISALQKAQLDFVPYFIFGNPSETMEDIMKSIDFAIKLNPPYVVFAILLIMPKTDIFYRGMKGGIFKNDFWRDFVLNPTDNFKPLFWTENFSEEELDEILALAHRKFYRRPRYLLERLLEIRSITDLRRKLGIGLKILYGV